MRVRKRFEVPASASATYALLVDLERLGACIPGGAVGPRTENGSHPASIAVKVGPMRMSYAGTVQLGETDEAARRAVLTADVREQRGQGTAKATMSMAVTAAGSGSLVETVTDVTLTGRAAQLGQGVIEDVAEALVADMAACLAARLGGTDQAGAATAAQARPVKGLWLMVRALWAGIGRAFAPRRAGNGNRQGED